MIGDLPCSVTVNGNEYEINTDFRVALTILDAVGDPNLNDTEKAYVMLTCLYADFESVPPEDYNEACKQASLFLDGGRAANNRPTEKQVLEWNQDEQLIFAAINKVAGREIRAEAYVHWWTFLAYFTEIDDKSLLSTIIQLREKKAKGKKLEKWEQDFYKAHKDMVDIKRRISDEEQRRRDEINRLLGG